jgi:hypothetical protein
LGWPSDLATRVDHRRPEPTFECFDRDRLGGRDSALHHLRQEGPSRVRDPGVVGGIDAAPDRRFAEQRGLWEARAEKMLDQPAGRISARRSGLKHCQDPIHGLLPKWDVGQRAHKRPI